MSMNWEQDFQSRLDRDAQRRAEAHAAALNAAAAEHERIREVAEAVRQQAEYQAELERERAREAELQKLRQIRQQAEEQARLADEAHQRAIREEEQTRREAEQRRKKVAEEAEQRRRQQEAADREAELERQRKREADERAAAELRQQKEVEEKAKKDAALEAIKKAQAAKASAPQTQPQNQTALRPQANTQTTQDSAPGISSNAQKQQLHGRYLKIHRNMKELRTWLSEQAKTNKQLKTTMGDARREIRKNIGQLNIDTKKNTQQRDRILQTLLMGSTFSQPTTDITKFLIDPPPSSPETQVPALLIYLMNVFIKGLLRQFVGEGGVNLSIANPVGIVGSIILSNSQLHWQGRPLTDMLIAKLHVVCPVLFGIYGPEDTDAGKRRLGWRIVKDGGGGGGTWIPPQDHADRMTGFGSGFAALTLRSYEKARADNPFPPWHFWHAAACIANVPAAEVTPSHAYVLRAMMLDNEERILGFFGDYGVLLLKYALVDFPKKAPQNSPATQMLKILGEKLAKERKLYLV